MTADENNSNQNCTDPTVLEAGDLLGYLDGDVSEAVAAHIESCPGCQEELAMLQQTELAFLAAYARPECPEPDQLLDFVTGVLSDSKVDEINKHIEGCDACTAEIALLNRPVDLALPRITFLQKLREQAARILRAIPQAPAVGAAVPVLRGDADAEVIYEADGYRVMVQKEPPLAGEDAWQIDGHIVGGPTTLNGPVYLLKDEEMAYQDQLDELGYFAFENVGANRYTLVIHLGDELIQIEEFTIP